VSRLSLLLFVVPLVALVASGCGSKKSAAPQAVFAVQSTDPSATTEDLKSGADLLVARLIRQGAPRDEIHVQREGAGFTVAVARDLVPAKSLPLVTRQSTLEVYDLEKDLAGPSKTAQGDPQPETSLYSLLAPQQQDVEFKGADGWELFNSSTKRLVAGPLKNPEALFTTRVAQRQNIKPGKPPYVVFGIPKQTVAVSCGREAVICPGVAGPPTRGAWYLINPVPKLTSSDVASASAVSDPSQGSVVVVHLNAQGTRRLRELTRILFQRGQLEQSPQHVAFVVDRQIRSFPQIDYTDDTLANGISSGGLQITGLRSQSEAEELALAVEPLPVEFKRIR
jgi:hypothetical protein